MKKLRNYRWRLKNRHNEISLGNVNNTDIISVGEKSYGILNVYSFGNSAERLYIGNYVSIAEEVKFITGGNHFYEGITTFPLRAKFMGQNEAITKGPIVVKDDVWIGINSIILSGVVLGKGSIIAAGSVVTSSTKPYWIYGGNPAKPIKPRFDEKYIDIVSELDLSIYTNEFSEEKIEYAYRKIDDYVINYLVKRELISRKK